MRGRAGIPSWNHVTRPLEVSLRSLFLHLAGLDVLADELEVLRQNPVAVFTQRDLVDFGDGPRLVDPCLGLDVTDDLRLELILEGGGVELADDLAGLDGRTLRTGC